GLWIVNAYCSPGVLAALSGVSNVPTCTGLAGSCMSTSRSRPQGGPNVSSPTSASLPSCARATEWVLPSAACGSAKRPSNRGAVGGQKAEIGRVGRVADVPDGQSARRTTARATALDACKQDAALEGVGGEVRRRKVLGGRAAVDGGGCDGFRRGRVVHVEDAHAQARALGG